MQRTAMHAIEVARDERQSRRTADDVLVEDPERDFVMWVTMDLKESIDRTDLLSPLEPGSSTGGPRPHSPEEVQSAFEGFAKQLRPEFEKLTKFTLILSGVVVGAAPYRYVNLWDIGTPNDVPRMMEGLATPEDKSQLYGYLDYLVQEEAQDVLRVFPSGLSKVEPPAEGKRLYYVLLPHQPSTVNLWTFNVYFKGYPEPLPTPGKFKLISSTISVTGVLNRILQFWSLEVDASYGVDKVRELVKQAFGSLPWRNPDDERFNAEEAVVMRPTSWDDAYYASRSPKSTAKRGEGEAPSSTHEMPGA